MNRSIGLCPILLVGICFSMVPLFGVEGNSQPTDFLNALLNNQYLLESQRLTGLAEGAFAQGDYDGAIAYAEEAMKYAEMSDAYVSLQMKIKQAQDTIAAAQARLDWAASIGAPERYPQEYEEAQGAYGEACTARDGEHWDEAIAAASRVMDLLGELQEIPTLPAQYLVQTWIPMKDCLWNIAAKPQIYGDPLKWPILYRANKEKLPRPDDPDLIHPGMILDIPSINGETRKGLWDGSPSPTLLH